MYARCRSPFWFVPVLAVAIGGGILTVGMAQSSRELLEFHGIRPGESRLDSLKGDQWKDLVSQSSTTDGTRQLEFRIRPWKKVVVFVKEDLVIGVDLFAPRGLSGPDACEAFGLGRILPIDQLPAEAHFAAAEIEGQLSVSEATFTLIEMEDQDGLQRVKRLRFFGKWPLTASGQSRGVQLGTSSSQQGSPEQPTAPLAVAGVIQSAMGSSLSVRPPAAVAPFTSQQARSYQEAWAKYVGGPIVMTNSVGMRLNLIPPGEFIMGTQVSADEIHRRFPGGKIEWYVIEHPPHKVRITHPYYLGAQEVRVSDFERFVRATGYKTTAEIDGYVWEDRFGEMKQVEGLNWRNPGFEQQSTHPVIFVSWDDAVAFCEWLSHVEGRTYRLPTEAEWEYACRAGTDTLYFWGDNPDRGEGYLNAADETVRPDGSAWTYKFSFKDGYATTSPVGRFQPNAFVLYDMLGNVWEWCSDWFGGYSSMTVDDPLGPSTGRTRVKRGGGWGNRPVSSRSAGRSGSAPSQGSKNVGFRVVFSPTAATGK
jgi:formylglycine-generating enzyme